MRARSRKSDETVHSITGARRGLTDDVAARQRRYALSMGLRTVCFILAALTPGWPRWVFLAGAMVLPYIAVVVANAGRERVRDMAAFEPPVVRAAIPARRADDFS